MRREFRGKMKSGVVQRLRSMEEYGSCIASLLHMMETSKSDDEFEPRNSDMLLL